MFGQFLLTKNTQKGEFSKAPRQQKVFQAFFYMFTGIDLKLAIYILYAAWHIEFEFHRNRDTMTYFAAKKKLYTYESVIFGAHLYGEGVDQDGSPPPASFQDFSLCFDM